MPGLPDPAEIFRRAAEEGRRRLDQTLLELIATSFIAGFTIIFGIIGLGLAHSAVEPYFPEMAPLAGALAFAIGLVFLIVGRAELFSENFFDPIATAFEREESNLLLRIARLWSVTFVLNLVGGVLLGLTIILPGVLPDGVPEVLVKTAEELAARGGWAAFMSAVIGGSLVALLSFMLAGADSIGGRIAIAYSVGFLLAAGPFDHVVVTTLHAVLGMLLGGQVGPGELTWTVLIATAGNLVGGVGLVTLSHAAQARGAEERGR